MRKVKKKKEPKCKHEPKRWSIPLYVGGHIETFQPRCRFCGKKMVAKWSLK